METSAAIEGRAKNQLPVDFEFLAPTVSSSKELWQMPRDKIDHFFQELVDQQEIPGGDLKRHHLASA